MFCAYTRPRYQLSVYRTIGPLVYTMRLGFIIFLFWYIQNFWDGQFYEEGFDQLAIVINFRVCGGNVEFLSQGDALSNTTYGEK